MKLIKDQYLLVDKNIIKQEQFITIYKCNTKDKQNLNIFEYFAFQYNKQEIQILEKVLISEIVAQKHLKHKGYLPIIDYQQGQNSIYIITPIYNQTLDQLLKNKQKLKKNIEDIQIMFKQLLQTYAYHYYMNMSHFNISPENIIVNGQKYLLRDMGFNHHLKYITKKPILQIYDSPQRIQNCPFSSKADIWSLGVILYECLTGYKSIITESFTIYPIQLDQANPFHQLIIKMTQFYECDRLSWQELYQHPYVINDLKLKILIDDKLYNIAQLQINQLQNVDLELLFGFNTKDDNISSISFQEYKITLQKLGVPFANYAETLFIIQAGSLDERLEQSALKQWMNQGRLIGLRSFHKQLQPQEKQNMLNFKEEIDSLQERLNIQPQEIQFQQSYLGLKLSKEAKTVIQSIRTSFEKYNSSLQEVFKKYDPLKIGGIDYIQLNNMLIIIYPQDVQENFKKEVFNFINISRTGIIQIKEFKELIFDLDINKLQ